LRQDLTETEKRAVREFTERIAAAFPDRLKLSRLFGSRARGDGDPDSDLDLLLVLDKNEGAIDQEISEAMAEVNCEYGTLIAPISFDEEELHNLTYRQFRLIHEAVRDGIDFWRAPHLEEGGSDFLGKVLEENATNRGKEKGIERMMREQIRTEVEEGKECLQAAKVLANGNLYSHAVSKAYFAMFHLCEALLLSRKIERRKHAKLIGAFHKQFRKEGLFDEDLHGLLDRAYKDRQKADYKMFKFDESHAEARIAEAEEFIVKIERVLRKEDFI